MFETLTALGIESSCDDTAASVVCRHADGTADIRSSIVFGQGELHRPYGGVVPEVAARAHTERLDHCAQRALHSAGMALSGIDLLAVTAGPGLIGGLMAGIAFAKGLAAGSGKPLIGVNHLAGHALTGRMTHGLCFPYLALLVSGGHCQFLAVKSADQFLRLGGTIDDAPGEAFDKSARVLGLAQPGGPAIEAAAMQGYDKRFRFPRPLSGRDGCNMSFSGLKTALLKEADRLRHGGALAAADVCDLSAGFEAAVADVLVEKTAAAAEAFRNGIGEAAHTFTVCGGVAANRRVRDRLEALCASTGMTFVAPAPHYCTDNAAMIAWAGIERFRLGHRDGFALGARPRWPLDEVSPPILGSGRKGPKS
ncbi:MAG: tRNA (adenosine(37)-N6)-threonylcarbamoyltransferase complex transferase subunit TsaD [Rhodobacteraceae bacterium]|nr:tRNA (adenosine(37)-N6)-threonylcarbamoyltransferase complex transferase subunit TsaD [Paracoccaceae bacterium]